MIVAHQHGKGWWQLILKKLSKGWIRWTKNQPNPTDQRASLDRRVTYRTVRRWVCWKTITKKKNIELNGFSEWTFRNINIHFTTSYIIYLYQKHHQFSTFPWYLWLYVFPVFLEKIKGFQVQPTLKHFQKTSSRSASIWKASDVSLH